MDPFAVLTSVSSLLKDLENFRARMNPEAELLMLMNSLTDLQVILVTVRDCADLLKQDKLSPTTQSYYAIIGALEKVQVSSDRVSQFVWSKLLRNGNGIARLSLGPTKKAKLLELRASIKEAHQNLQLALLSANLRTTPALRTIIEETAFVQQNNHAEVTASLGQLLAQITALKAIDGPKSGQQGQADNSRPWTTLTSNTIGNPPKVNSTAQIRVTTSVTTKACPLFCNCQCHVRTNYRTPRWVSAVAGTLFYSSNTNLSLGIRPCNSVRCVRSQPSSTSRFTYYFPQYIMKGAILYSNWSSLSGKNSSWTLRMPREISAASDCWDFVQYGCIAEIKELLVLKKISPFDVGRDYSLFSYALDFLQIEIVELLSNMGADWNFSDAHGRTATDFAWSWILAYPDSPIGVKLKSMVEPEDSLDLKLSPLHRIVLGLSSADLELQIEMDPGRIDDVDWMGKTPLMWAAHRADCASVRMLLSRGANTNLAARSGATALHWAAKGGSFDCLKQLLDAQGDPSVKDHNGITLLHFLAGRAQSQSELDKSIFAIKNAGVDIDAKDDNGLSPLLRAVINENIIGVKALLKHGADVNCRDKWGFNPISRSILDITAGCLSIICQFDPETSWEHTQFQVGNILEVVALYGSVDKMNTLAESTLSPIEYDADMLHILFTHGRNHNDLRARGLSRSPKEELAAFEDLVRKKGIPIGNSFASLTQIIGPSRVVEENDKDDWDGDGTDEDGDIDDWDGDGTDEDGDIDVFEDALEELAP